MAYAAVVAAPWDDDLAVLNEFAAGVTAPEWDPRQPLAAIGLQLSDTPPYAYPDTPANAHPILSCGMDGIHWSAMTADTPSSYIVVMTVPPSTGVNVVVGESLQEFLALGCRSNFLNLGGLVEDFAYTLDPEDEEAAPLMAALRDHFGLTPWPDIPGRLTELAARHGRPEGRVPRDPEAEAELMRLNAEGMAWMKQALGDQG